MQRPRMSTGAWIFVTAVTVAAITAPSVYAAATSTVAIGNPKGAATATVTGQHQLLTTTIAPKDVVHAQVATGGGSCVATYLPPAGMALVVSSVNYDVGVFMSSGAQVLVNVTGYLIPATQLPAAASAAKLPSRPHGTH